MCVKLFFFFPSSLGATIPEPKKPEPAGDDLGEEEPEISPSEGDPGDESLKSPPKSPPTTKVWNEWILLM